MEERLLAVCPENDELQKFMWQKLQEIAERSKGISDNTSLTLFKAYSNVCNSKIPIRTLRELSSVKGVGKWILKQMKDFFETNSDAAAAANCEPGALTNNGKKINGTKRYVPQKNSVAYTLLITMYRAITKGSEFLRKQEIIDAAEASGLSRVPIIGAMKGMPVSWFKHEVHEMLMSSLQVSVAECSIRGVLFGA